MPKPKVTKEAPTALETVLQSYDGRELLMEIMEEAGLHSSLVAREDRDFNAGRQSVAHSILNKILQTSPTSFTLMLNEKIRRDELDDAGESNVS